MTLLDDDYTESDRWDWDQSDDSQYCQHGTFIGSWWGPDILCGWCEDGISYVSMRRALKAQARRALAREAEQLDAAFANLMESVGYKSSLATWFTSYIMDHVEPKHPKWVQREYLTGKRVHR